MMNFISMNLRDYVRFMDGHFHSYALQTWQTLGLCIQDVGTAFAVFFVGEFCQMYIALKVGRGEGSTLDARRALARLSNVRRGLVDYCAASRVTIARPNRAK